MEYSQKSITRTLYFFYYSKWNQQRANICDGKSYFNTNHTSPLCLPSPPLPSPLSFETLANLVPSAVAFIHCTYSKVLLYEIFGVRLSISPTPASYLVYSYKVLQRKCSDTSGHWVLPAVGREYQLKSKELPGCLHAKERACHILLGPHPQGWALKNLPFHFQAENVKFNWYR